MIEKVSALRHRDPIDRHTHVSTRLAVVATLTDLPSTTERPQVWLVLDVAHVYVTHAGGQINLTPAGGAFPGFGPVAGQIDIGDSAANGVAGTASRADHQHAFPAPSAGYPIDVAATEADGTATTPARSDHRHAHGTGYAGGHTDGGGNLNDAYHFGAVGTGRTITADEGPVVVNNDGLETNLIGEATLGARVQMLDGLEVQESLRLTNSTGVLSGDTLTASNPVMYVQSESGTSDTMSRLLIVGPVTYEVGDIVILRPTAGHDITLSHNAGHGNGNLLITGNANAVMDDDHDMALCVFDGTNWAVSVMHSGNMGAGSAGHTILDETSALSARTKLSFLGAGVKAIDDSGNDETEVVVGAYFDAIVDNNDTNAKDKGNVYSTLQGAIDAGHTSVFVRSAGDVFANSRLSASMDSSQTTIPVVELADYPTAGFVLIEREIIQYTGKSAGSGAGNLTGGTRGAKNTTAAAHTIDSGTATAGANQSAPLKTGNLTNSGETWTVDEHRDKTLVITGGTGNGQSRRIIANIATVLLVENPWTTVPDSTSTYEIRCSVGTAIGIGTSENIQRIEGEESVNAALPVHLSIQKTDGQVAYMHITGDKRLLFQGARGTAFACLFTGTGRWETLGVDATVIACRFVGSTVTPAIVWAANTPRFISTTWLACSGPSCISIDTPTNVSVVGGSVTGCVFNNNTCTAYLISTVRGATGGGLGSVLLGLLSWNIAGNTFIRFDAGGILLRGKFISIAGNLFDGQTLVSGQRAIYQEGSNSGITNAGVWSVTGNSFGQLDISFDNLNTSSNYIVLIGNNVFGDTVNTTPGSYCTLSDNMYYNAPVTLPGETSIIGGVVAGTGAIVSGRGATNLVRGVMQIGAGAGWDEGGPIAGEGGNTFTTLALSNGNNDNIAIATYTQYVRITGPTGAFTIRGIANGNDGQTLTIYNTTTQNMTLNHEDAGSTAANRIRMMDAANKVTTGEGLVELIYDGTSQRWLYKNGAL